MGIRLKILGVLALVLLIYIALTQLVYSLVILPSYADLEKEEALEDINRCLDALDREIAHLDTVTHDWAAWDDTYQFVQDANDGYRQSNLLQQTFIDNRINAILIFNLQKEMIWGEVRSLESGEKITPAALSERALQKDPILFETRDGESGVSGLKQTSAGPLLFSCRPITTSDHQSPVIGHLIMGRYLDAEYARRLRDQTHIDHDYLPVKGRSAIIDNLASTATVSVKMGFKVEDAGTLNGFALIEDVYGEPALVLKTALSRHIYRQGIKTLRLTLLTVGFAGLVILFLMVMLMNRTVIGPLVKLTGRVVAIKDSVSPPPPLFSRRKDEIGILCREFNAMIDQLNAVNNGLAAANTQLRSEIKERERSETKLRVNREKLRALSSQLTLIEERERRRIASDLHDRISQSLALTQIKLGLLGQSKAPCPLEALAEVENEIASIIQDTRTLTFEISPPILYELGVEAAIEWVAESMLPEHGIRFSVRHDGTSDGLSDSIRVLVFRSVRELLMNIVKHARANRVEIRLTGSPTCFQVAVQDDGIGFDPFETGPEQPGNDGFGLFSIEERLLTIGGTFDIHSLPGKGTRVTLTAPIRDGG